MTDPTEEKKQDILRDLVELDLTAFAIDITRMRGNVADKEELRAKLSQSAQTILTHIQSHHTAQIAALKQRIAELEGEHAGEDQASYEYRLITNRKHGHFVALESIGNPSKVSIENIVHECRLTNSIEKMGDNEFSLISASGEELNGFKYAVCNDSLEKKAWSEFEKRTERVELASQVLGDPDA